MHEFTCPNCRAQAYLNADVEEPEGYAESFDSLADEVDQTQIDGDPADLDAGVAHSSSRPAVDESGLVDDIGELRMTDDDGPALAQADLLLPPSGITHTAAWAQQDAEDTPDSEDDEAAEGQSEEPEAGTSTSPQQASAPVDIPRQGAGASSRRPSTGASRARTPTVSGSRNLVPDVLNGEGPLTPRNNAGPFVFDGSADDPAAQRASVDGRNEMTNLNSIV